MPGISPGPLVSIAYHSGFGHTDVLAEAVRAGAVDTGAAVHLIRVDEITDEQWSALDSSDAIILGSPTYMGTASGAFHVFAEATSKRFAPAVWRDKLAAGFTNSGAMSGDKLHTLQFFTVLAAQLGMHWINLGLHPGWNTSQASENDLNRLGFHLGAAAQTNVDQGAEAVHKADIATAEHLGRSVARTATVFRAGRLPTA
ncbi:flavodoxin family protein [Streptomyces sp. NPDC087270]|uniref:flavodoxin family protein n=1 Tax=Streptomyces sp. NPDC087270 TaxID=3365774 RepID=UPI0037F9D8D5